MKIAAVIVAFNPDHEELQAHIKAVSSQVSHVVLVDNSPVQSSFVGVSEYIWFPENVGVGRGQNVGIEKAEGLGVEQVLLLDQDSIVHPEAVNHLSRAIVSANDIAAVGPVYRELNSGQLSGFFRVGLLGPKRIKGSSLDIGETVRTDFLISAGTLMCLDAFHNIGKMREDFFIDYIDTEWCIRADHAGYQLLGVGGELMGHRIGDAHRRIWIGKWRSLPIYSSTRLAVSLRNLRKLLQDQTLSKNWKSLLALRFVQLCVLHPVISIRSLKSAMRSG